MCVQGILDILPKGFVREAGLGRLGRSCREILVQFGTLTFLRHLPFRGGIL
jgi:hypothetical protein